jgi:hypothetical protein
MISAPADLRLGDEDAFDDRPDGWNVHVAEMVGHEKEWRLRNGADNLDRHTGYSRKTPRPQTETELAPVQLIRDDKRADKPGRINAERDQEEYQKAEARTNISHSLESSFSVFLKLYRSKNLMGNGFPARSAGRQFIDRIAAATLSSSP